MWELGLALLLLLPAPPAPRTVSFEAISVTIPTYPYAEHLTTGYNPTYNITYPVLNWNTYNPAGPPAPRQYTLLVLENEYLYVTLLPELGGRVYQMVYKPTGHDALYQNPVIKPTRWGPPEQGWWLAAGGIEWCLPVEEHGYEWGTLWGYEVITSTDGVAVTLRDTRAVDRLRAAVTVALPAGRAYLAVSPRIENPTSRPIHYKYWTNAMLAPGAANTVGADLRLVYSSCAEAAEMAVHSTGDPRLPGHWPTVPAGPDYRFTWPLYNGVDFSRLGNWGEWLGYFEYPQARCGFVAAYDEAADEGVARVFPPDVARGSKGFGFGWATPIHWSNWTDDGSAYFEIHGGVAPTFWETATLAAGEHLSWTEYWYPLGGLGGVSAATEEAALRVSERDGRFHIGLHSTAPRAAGTHALYAWDRATCARVGSWEGFEARPGQPFSASVETAVRALAETTFAYLSGVGETLAAVNLHVCPPPRAMFAPLSSWTAANPFTVTWRSDTWAGLARYDVQVRDGYEGEWRDWLTDTLGASGVFTGAHGHTYFFRARARDPYGRWGEAEWGQTFTTFLAEPAPVLVTSRKSASPTLLHAGRLVTYTVLVSNTGSLTAAVVWTDSLPAGVKALTETLAATPGLTLVYSAALRWSGTVAPGEEVRVSYVVSPPTAAAGTRLTNTVEIAGSVLGPFTRRAVVVWGWTVWLPAVMRGW